jgi:hypothetical protein
MSNVPVEPKGSDSPTSGAGAESDGFWPRFKRYLVGSYVPTLMHALFHLMGVLLAFIMASAWSARENELKDVRTQLAVLNALLQEADGLYKQANNWDLDAPPNPCSRAFYSADTSPSSSTGGQAAGAGREQKIPELLFTTPIWQGVFVSDHALVIRKDTYNELRQTYGDLALAPAATAVKCGGFLKKIRGQLERLKNDLDSDRGDAESRLTTLDNALWSPRYDRNIRTILLVWISIMLSPAVIFALELVWKQQGATYVATMPVAQAYAQGVGILLLLITGFATVLTHSLSLNADAYYRLINLAGGAIATYVGFLGNGTKPLARVFGVVFTVIGVAVLIHPAAMGNLTPATSRAYSLLYLVVGLGGMWAGFGRKIVLLPLR